MSKAPVTLIAVAPVPPESGSTLTVAEDEGAVYPPPPWVGLVWPTQQLPKLGVNAEELAVTAVDGDELTFTRSDNPISITRGLQLAATETVPVYRLGESINLRQDFGSDDPAYHLVLRGPTGAIMRRGVGVNDGDDDADDVNTGLVDEGNGVVAATLKASAGGIWHYRWESNAGPRPEQVFFVSQSDTLE